MRVKLGSSSTSRIRAFSIAVPLLGSDAVQHHGGARASTALFVPDSYRTSVQRYDRLADREAEPGPLAGRLGREERIEEPGAAVLVDSRPGVLDLDHDRPLSDLEGVGSPDSHVRVHLREPVEPGAD